MIVSLSSAEVVKDDNMGMTKKLRSPESPLKSLGTTNTSIHHETDLAKGIGQQSIMLVFSALSAAG